MKKLITILFAVIITASSFAQQAGRVRISFVGFQCIRETSDDILHLDGKVDEVFLNFSFTMAGLDGTTKFKYQNRTGIYGDAHGPFSNRISAGSALDLFGNLKGGIRGGDSYSCNNIIGEYDMAAGDVLSVVPTIWEWDNGSDNFSSFIGNLENSFTSMNQTTPQVVKTFSPATMGLSALVTDGGVINIPAFSDLRLRGIARIGTRPIGITLEESFVPKVVILNSQILQAIAGSNYGYGQGVIPVQYNEEALGNSRDHGNYIVLIRAEFTAKASAPAPAPPPPVATGNTSKNPTGNLRKTTRPSSGNTITGSWIGTYGNGESNNTNYYSFRMNADGTMQVVAANGNVMANGNYTYTNNQLTGNYNYTNSGNYSFSATMDTNGTLNGTWGSGSNVRGGGRWMMSKQ